MQGKDHAKVAVVLWAGAAGASWALYAAGDTVAASGVMYGAFTGWLITPDIDVNGTTHEEYRLYKIFWPIGFVWQNFWAPYGLAFAHRGWSHTPFIGTATRVVYILLMLTAITLFWNEGTRMAGLDLDYTLDTTYFFQFVDNNRLLCGWWYLVWSIQDIGHYVADKISTAMKKEARRAVQKGESW